MVDPAPKRLEDVDADDESSLHIIAKFDEYFSSSDADVEYLWKYTLENASLVVMEHATFRRAKWSPLSFFSLTINVNIGFRSEVLFAHLGLRRGNSRKGEGDFFGSSASFFLSDSPPAFTEGCCSKRLVLILDSMREEVLVSARELDFEIA